MIGIVRPIRVFFVMCLGVILTTPAFAGAINTSAIDDRIQDMMNATNMVGLAVAIVEDGEITFVKGYGETVKGNGDKITGDTVFRWASVSKGVAAATVLNLAEDGHFGLSSPIKAHAPSLNLPESKYMATVEDILTHRVGIVRNAYDTRIEDGHDAKLVRAALKDLPRLCEPGDCHTYQNVAYDAVAEMVENATGVPYKSIVSERLFKPLDMTTARLSIQGLQQSKSWARPHNLSGRKIERVKPTYYRLPGAAGVNSSVTDLAKWMMAQMRSGDDVVPSVMQAELQTPRVYTPRENRLMKWRYPDMKNAHYGLGWRVYDYAGHRVIGHRGAVEGYRAQVLFDPEKQSGIAVMWNSPHSRPVGLQFEFLDQLYGRPGKNWIRLAKK